MWTLLVIAAAMVWLMFFWTPGPEPAANVAFETPANEKRSLSHVVASPIPRLCSEHVWYGMTFHGYQDDYCISVAGKCHGLAGMVRAYFIRKKATVVVEDGGRMRFSRGKTICGYLGGPDTWMPQEIDVTFETTGEITTVAVQYRVSGWHLRLPPNQLRSEVLQLEKSIQGLVAESIASRHALGC